MPAGTDRALIAMSGGIDSSAAAAILIERGLDCAGLTLKLHDENKNSKAGLPAAGKAAGEKAAEETAAMLGIKHFSLDLTEIFRDRVIKPFVETYEKGATPNPCVICNRRIKFDFNLFAPYTGHFDIYATGHYAQIEKSGSRWLLKKAVDCNKDQSYVLFGLGQDVLARSCFPLGNLTKATVREMAESRGFAGAKAKESQDICFIPDGDYGAFIESYTGRRSSEGDILDSLGNAIGRHKGHFRYTLGQRRGLGVALNQPLYVSAKDADANTITLAPESSLYAKTLKAGRINLIACENLEKPARVMVKTRYMQQEHPATAFQTGAGELYVEFDEAQRALTPGQAAVLYDGDIVIGGGIITEVNH